MQTALARHHTQAASAADLKFLHCLLQARLGTSNRRHWTYRLASAPLLPKFVSEGAAMYHELRITKFGSGAPGVIPFRDAPFRHALHEFRAGGPPAGEARGRG